jgi:hypothetical protein
MNEFKLNNHNEDELVFKNGRNNILDITFTHSSGLIEDIYIEMDIVQCKELINFLKNKVAIYDKK